MDTINGKIRLITAILAVFFVSTAWGDPVLLTQDMINAAGSTFYVTKDYIADGAVLHLGNRQKLVFNGGSFDQMILVGNHSRLEVKGKKPVFGKNVCIKGIWDVREAHDGWFVYEEGTDFIANQLIKNMLAFSNDSSYCHLFFEEDRTYYFELPYHGDAAVGDMFTYHIRNGKKIRHYGELYDDNYSFLRIFTIPSNTKITLNNTMQMLPTGLGAYFVFWEYGKENVIIEGNGTIAGDNKVHDYTTPFTNAKFYGEWGHIFRCFKCKNFVFKGITLRDSFGDCLMFQGSQLPDECGVRYADGLLVENVSIIGARRNGMAIGARNVVIRKCCFVGCGSDAAKGTSPRSAVDFEPDDIVYYSEIGNQNVLMENCTFIDNYYDVASYSNNLVDYGKVATTIKNCVFTAPLKITNTFWLRFEKCYIPFIWSEKDSASKSLYSKYLEFLDCDFGPVDYGTINTWTKMSNTFTNCKYNIKK